MLSFIVWLIVSIALHKAYNNAVENDFSADCIGMRFQVFAWTFGLGAVILFFTNL